MSRTIWYLSTTKAYYTIDETVVKYIDIHLVEPPSDEYLTTSHNNTHTSNSKIVDVQVESYDTKLKNETKQKSNDINNSSLVSQTTCNGNLEDKLQIMQRITSVESALVKIIDMVTNLHGDIKKQHVLEATIDSLTKDKDKLANTMREKEKQNIKHSESETTQLQVNTTLRKSIETTEKKCKNLESELSSARIENKELKKNISDRSLEHELNKSKLENRIILLESQLDTSSKRIRSMSSEIDSLNVIIQTKNEAISSQEVRIKNLNIEIAGVHDKLLAEKLHNSRIDDTLLNFDNSLYSTPKAQNIDLSTQPVIEKRKSDMETTISKETKQTPHKLTDVTTVKIQQKEQAQKDVLTQQKPQQQKRSSVKNMKSTQRKQVLLIGTSNTRFVSTKYVAGGKFYVRKEIKYTHDEAISYIQSYNGDMVPDVVIYHLLCNDNEKLSNSDIIEKSRRLLKVTKEKFPNPKIIISLGLPRKKKGFNLKINTLNMEMQNEYKNDGSIVFCDNSNLFYRGVPLRGVLEDELHLSKQGTFEFSANLKEELYKTL